MSRAEKYSPRDTSSSSEMPARICWRSTASSASMSTFRLHSSRMAM